MHLIELIEVLEKTKHERGNIALVDVIIMAAGGGEALVDFNTRKIHEVKPKVVIDTTGMNEEQVDELRAQYPDAEFIEVPAAQQPVEFRGEDGSDNAGPGKTEPPAGEPKPFEGETEPAIAETEPAKGETPAAETPANDAAPETLQK